MLGDGRGKSGAVRGLFVCWLLILCWWTKCQYNAHEATAAIDIATTSICSIAKFTVGTQLTSMDTWVKRLIIFRFSFLYSTHMDDGYPSLFR